MSDGTIKVPEGCLQDNQGRFVPVEMIEEIDLLRTDLVESIVERAIALGQQIAKVKADFLSEIDAFTELSASQFGVKMGGQKGNLTLTSFNGEYQVRRMIADRLTFNERLQVAKRLIDECIEDWSEGSRPEIKVLVTDAFKVNKEGKLDTKRILELRRLKIPENPTWERAMEAIGKSIQVESSAVYLRIYKRNPDSGKYEAINLDIASV